MKQDKRKKKVEEIETFFDYAGEPADITAIATRNKLDDTDVQILRLILEKPAITFTEIGRIVGLHRQNVRKRCNKPNFRAAFDDYNKGAFDKIFDLQVEAIKVLERLLASKNEAIRFRAAKTLVYGDPKLLHKKGSADDASGTTNIVYDLSKAHPEDVKDV